MAFFVRRRRDFLRSISLLFTLECTEHIEYSLCQLYRAHSVSQIGFFSDPYNSLKMLEKKKTNKTKRSSHSKAEERGVINLFCVGFTVLYMRASMTFIAKKSLFPIVQ